MLSTPERLQDARNHCVPILDYIEGDEGENISFLVMPLLRKFDDPPFYFVEEIVDFVRQTLEVREFLHFVLHRLTVIDRPQGPRVYSRRGSRTLVSVIHNNRTQTSHLVYKVTCQMVIL